MKAAFVFNFAKFTVWPPGLVSGAEPLHLCVHAQGPDAGAMESLQDKAVEQRRVNVVTFADDLPENCHLIFVSGNAGPAQLQEIARKGGDRHALTISDDAHFARRGGHIALVRSENRLRFEVNLKAVSRSGL